jgi:hypothetical protein
MELHNAQADFLFGFGLCFVSIGFVLVKVSSWRMLTHILVNYAFITHCSNIYIVQTSGKFGMPCNQGRNVMLPFSRGDSVPLM